MERTHYFELIIGDAFERNFFLLNGVHYLIKYTGSTIHQNFCGSRGKLTIENKSVFPVFAMLKLYIKNNQDYVLARSSVLNDKGSLTINFDGFNGGSFICSVKVIRHENWQNTVDSAKKGSPTEKVTSSKSPTTESRFDDLASNMRRLLEQGDLSDVILVSDGSKEFRAHKLILSARSSVFSKMFQHPMKENLENRVPIADVSSEVLKELLTFIYTGVVIIKDTKMARDLYVVADKYDVKELLAVCSKNLKDVDLDSVLDTLALADFYGDDSLKQSALDFIAVNYLRVEEHEKWKSFMKENHVLALEVLSFVLHTRA